MKIVNLIFSVPIRTVPFMIIVLSKTQTINTAWDAKPQLTKIGYVFFVMRFSLIKIQMLKTLSGLDVIIKIVLDGPILNVSRKKVSTR